MNEDAESQINGAESSEASFYHEEQASTERDFPNLPAGQQVSWTASEYIAHHKTASWYILLALATALVSVLVFLISRDILTIIAIIVVAISFGFFASRQPNTLDYRIDQHGVTIGGKLHPYDILRTFSIQDDGAINSILLIPLKRFTPAISLYYPPEQEEDIMNVLSSYLPHEERDPDLIDRLMRHIRF